MMVPNKLGTNCTGPTKDCPFGAIIKFNDREMDDGGNEEEWCICWDSDTSEMWVQKGELRLYTSEYIKHKRAA